MLRDSINEKVQMTSEEVMKKITEIRSSSLADVPRFYEEHPEFTDVVIRLAAAAKIVEEVNYLRSSANAVFAQIDRELARVAYVSGKAVEIRLDNCEICVTTPATWDGKTVIGGGVDLEFDFDFRAKIHQAAKTAIDAIRRLAEPSVKAAENG